MAEYIEREALLKCLNYRTKTLDDGKFTSGVNSAMEIIEEVVGAFPAIDVRPVTHGKWEDVYDSSKEREVTKCSVCHCITIYFDSPFCQWCGAKMDGKDNLEWLMNVIT